MDALRSTAEAESEQGARGAASVAFGAVIEMDQKFESLRKQLEALEEKKKEEAAATKTAEEKTASLEGDIKLLQSRFQGEINRLEKANELLKLELMEKCKELEAMKEESEKGSTQGEEKGKKSRKKKDADEDEGGEDDEDEDDDDKSDKKKKVHVKPIHEEVV